MLDFMLMPFRRYAEFSGRSRRMEYWSFALFNLIVMTVIVGIAMASGFSLSMFGRMTAGADPSLFFGTGMIVLFSLAGLYWLAIIVPTIAVTVRRLHDREMSGWWYLGFIVLGMIPVVGWIANIAFLVITFLPGTVGPNRFGDDPKDPSGAEVFA